MDKKKSEKLKRYHVPTYMVGLITLLILLGGSYLARGWVRVTLVPKTIQLFEASGLKSDTEKELSSLGDPLSLLGYKTVQKSPSRCSLGLAKHFSEEVTCSYTVSAFDLIPQNDVTRSSLDAASKKIENALQKDGWTGEYSDSGQYTSLHMLVTNISRGIDSTPDASYFKQVGTLTCLFQATSASSSPKPVAMAAQISCQKNFKVFGAVVF